MITIRGNKHAKRATYSKELQSLYIFVLIPITGFVIVRSPSVRFGRENLNEKRGKSRSFMKISLRTVSVGTLLTVSPCITGDFTIV